MKKIAYLFAATALTVGVTSCDDFLDTSSPSTVDAELILTDPTNCAAALAGAYSSWEAPGSATHSQGFSYDVANGSDIEHHAETYAAQMARTVPEAFYPDVEKFSIDYANAEKAWKAMYSVIAVCNQLAGNIEKTTAYEQFMADGKPTELSQTYGEAVVLRATAYNELCRHFGDVPYSVNPGESGGPAVSRWYIWEDQINRVMAALPVMNRVGESGQTNTKMSRTYGEALVGRMALNAAGYSTRRTDVEADFYTDAEGNVLSFEDIGQNAAHKAAYGRPTNYTKFLQLAQTALQACYDNPGTAKLITSDERGGDGKTYGNPFQRKYQYMNDRETSPELIYEIPYQQGVSGSERPYQFGRGSDGGGSNAYPCKSFAQNRFLPGYYYGFFQNADMRRDVTVAITGSDGKGNEILTKLTGGNKGSAGGFSLNKWDENRMATPYTKKQRQSGVSAPIMGFDDVILMLAEVDEALGNASAAQTLLLQVHNRAFATPQTIDQVLAAQGGNLREAIINERALEFGGEGYRRYDLIRTGLLPKYIAKTRAELKAIIADLGSKGYYEFGNGNQFPAYIWTKSVDAKSLYGYRLTTQCTDQDDPVLFPGWRGQHDDWASLGLAGGKAETNLAIKGLFKYIDPASDEAKALEADGYTKQDWGASFLSDALVAEYTTNWLCGYTDMNDAPLHLAPLASTTLEQNTNLTNGYGFQNLAAE